MRCNIGISPSLLLDQHLVAEYRELLIPYGQILYLKSNIEEILKKIPSKFCLGKGHVSFFRDKQFYLMKRFFLLKDEMIARGFEPKLDFWNMEKVPLVLAKDWKPINEDIILIKERIKERFLSKPDWYKFHGEKISQEDYLNKLSNA